MPGTSAHGTHQSGQHGERHRAPRTVAADLGILPDKPDGGDPFDDAGDVDYPGGDGEGVHEEKEKGKGKFFCILKAYGL